MLGLYVGPLILFPSSAGELISMEQNTNKDFLPAYQSWLTGWDNRTAINLIGAPGAGTNYQINITVLWTANMQNAFGDIRFTDVDGFTLLDYWLESYIEGGGGEPGYGYFWVEIRDNLDTNQTIYMYHGNPDVSTTNNGHTTFQEFYDKDSTTGWSLSNIAVSTSGDFLRFYNPTAGDVGEAQRWDISTSDDFQYMAQYKTVSLSAADQLYLLLGDGSASHRLGVSLTPIAAQQDQWWYYDGTTKAGGAWTEGTEFIFTITVDEGDNTNGIDYRRYDTSWVLQDEVLNENFAFGSPTDCDGIYLGDVTGAGTIDVYFRWIAFRKCIDSPPVFGSWGEHETDPSEWLAVNIGRFIFPVGWDPVAQFGYNTFFIFLGLIMIPTSMMYLVRGGRKEASTDKLFYALIIFVMGWALFLGGIMP